MPTETLYFLIFTLIAFGGFAVTLAYVDASTKRTRRHNHPLPGE
ncbi:hypothetical protein [Ancylobacter mangrovi]|uniref:Uncharacterized protein n=1 Tax=Ancylobacter mangrovi TaxID=2972472 RepID=A0A9X2PD06_9HYPH|nr:hypothetical protein [Ancylobacter mangrovi]MCS0493710.1 hypothetical protein [Ancylobacter mangrovi]MCS0501672.1 hypothetical protein [Ancylobacter mangrovi]